MKLFGILALLSLVLVSGCSEKKSKRGPSKDQYTCKEKSMDCSVRPLIDWEFLFDKTDFPVNVLLAFSGKTLLNQCAPETYYTISRSEIISIYLPELAPTISNSEYDVQVFDMGDCTGEMDLFLDLKAKFTLEEWDGRPFLQFDLSQ